MKKYSILKIIDEIKFEINIKTDGYASKEKNNLYSRNLCENSIFY